MDNCVGLVGCFVSGLLYLFLGCVLDDCICCGELLCFGIVVLIVGRFSMRVADPKPQLWRKGCKGMVV